jgi:hypothetical protein
MTMQEILSNLDLLPFDEFEYEQLLRLRERVGHLSYKQAVEARYRQTGRTTKMLVGALVDMLNESDLFIVLLFESVAQAKYQMHNFSQFLNKLQLEYTEDEKSIQLVSNGSKVYFLKNKDASEDTQEAIYVCDYYEVDHEADYE